jgi:DNA polymerase-3 subunit gamma/tau
MAYKALYRTYRPQQFSQVAGQQAIVKTLQNALLNQKLSHAYLFSGPRGTGKTTLAKIFAKALNCETSPSEPCGVCENCKALQDNRHPDVIEIDAASNNGVDEVRELIDKVKYAPIKGKYKVYIIDEVHMMTSGAFNALLKTLEEPPSHVLFILATTEPHKILPTILSRCQRFDFGKVNANDLRNRLELILKTEQITFDDAAIQTIIQLADGGVRDALARVPQVQAQALGVAL